MATKKESDDLDDLLGDDPVIKSAGNEDIDELLGSNPLASKGKVKEPRIPREYKGEMVTFTNKAGQRIIGPGVLYYVARMDGKLHYKEKSQVVILPDTWKMGDPIPGVISGTDELA